MIREVPTGDLGLDVILGGGWRLVERLPGRESATVLVRGGPGTGKTLLSVDIALALATALNGDVVVACVELLPSEYSAQIEASRAELAPQSHGKLRETRLVMLPQTEPVAAAESPRIFIGLVGELDPSAPDLVAALESLRKEVAGISGKPVAFIVDSLISGYGLGPATQRQNVDAVMKFAAQQGVGLVLCEETVDDAPSSWDFAADTVLALDYPRDGTRQIFVRKHRFGPSAPGAHQLEIGGWKQPRVWPRIDAWFGAGRVRTTLDRHGWSTSKDFKVRTLHWIDDLVPKASKLSFTGSFAVVSGQNLQLVRKLAMGLVPENVESWSDIVIQLDPLGLESDGWSSNSVLSLSVAAGPKAAVCEIVEYFGRWLFPRKDVEMPRRIVIGDVATVATLADSAMWAECIRVVAALVAESEWGIPVIAHDSSIGFALHRWSADLVVEVTQEASGVTGYVTSRLAGTVDQCSWSVTDLAKAWPEEIAHLERLRRPGF